MVVINTRKENMRYPSKFQYTAYCKKKNKQTNSIPSNNGGRSYNSFVSVCKFAIYQSMSI